MDENKALDWSSEITKDDEYELLPEGVYDFEVKTFERGRFDGSDKMPPCPMAGLTLSLKDPISGKTGTVKENLFLASKSEWRLSQFFTSIGLKKKGEPLRMDWTKVAGARGRLELEVNKYMNKDGNQRENNRVKRFLPAEKKVWSPGQGF